MDFYDDSFFDDGFDEFDDDSFDDLNDFYDNEEKHKDIDYTETFEEYIKGHDFDLHYFSDDKDRYKWRSFYLGHPEFGIYPEDYETEKEYKKALNKAQYPWREYCEDGWEFGVDPEDYKTEEEYKKALNRAKYDWRIYCDDPLYTGVDPENYETEEEYQEALEYTLESVDDEENNAEITLNISFGTPFVSDESEKVKEEDYSNKRRFLAADLLINNSHFFLDEDYDKKMRTRCKFICDNADTIIAADYLSYDGGFLFAQAIKDNFTVPCSLPDEDEKSEIALYKILRKIAKRDVPLSFEVWSWCLEQFLPYSEYDEYCAYNLSGQVISYLYEFPEGYITKLVHYMDDNENFCKSLLTAEDDPISNFPELVTEAIKEKLFKTANSIFNSEFEKIKSDWKMINEYTEDLISGCRNYMELETIEYLRDNYFPIIKAIPLGMVQDEIEDWEEEISEYINYLEDTSEKYAFTRKFAWRKTVPDGKEYDLNPLDYDTENEYLEALDYMIKEIRRQESDKKPKNRQIVKQAEFPEYEIDDNIYTYCGVLLPNSDRPYSFRTEDDSIKIGDTVIVPVGKNQKEKKGKVVSVGQYFRLSVPYPVEKTKLILRKVDNETD